MATLQKPPCYRSNDRAEAFVRDVLMHRPHLLENHGLRSIPSMVETIPGQYNAVNGIDIFGLDVSGSLWVIEVSRGVQRGAGWFKGNGKPVKYASGNLQMSLQWRTEAAKKFLNQQAHADTLLRILFGDTSSNIAVLRLLFETKMHQHKKAIILPDGAHFDAHQTDINFGEDIYTCRFPWGI